METLMLSLLSLLKSNPTCDKTKSATVDYLKKRSRLELLTGLAGINSLERADNELAKNREAESQAVRTKAWGQQQNGSGKGEDGMRDTVLGDVHVHQAAPSQLGKLLLGAGLLATGIGVPAGAWMIASGALDAAKKPSDPPAVSVPVEKPVERPAVNIGGYELRLGK